MPLFKGEQSHNMPSRSGILAMAVIAIIGLWIWKGYKGIPSGTSFTSADMGGGQGVRHKGGWGNPNTGEDNYEPYVAHHHMSYTGLEPVYEQPTVIQKGRRFPWYKFIDMTTYRQKPPFIEKPKYR